MKTSLLLVSIIYLTACSSIASIVESQDRSEKLARTNLQLGVGYFQQGRVDDALLKLKKALQAKSDYADAHSAIALVYADLGILDLADEHYMEAIELKEDDGATYNNYGVFLCQQNRLQEAEYYFLKALDSPRYRSPEKVYENAGACARKVPELIKAEGYLRKALNINEKLPIALHEMAHIKYSQNRFLSTRAYLQRYEEVAQYTPQSLWLGILVERKLGDQKAEMKYSKLLQTLYPDSKEFRQLLESSRGENTL